jgi:hypothetical protein
MNGLQAVGLLFPIAAFGLPILFLIVAIRSKLTWKKTLAIFLLMIVLALIALRAFFLIIS